MLTAVLALMLLSAPNTGEAKEEAKALLDSGNKRFAEGDFRGALEDFENAYHLYPSPKILVNLAEAHRELEHWVQAVLHYERFLRETPPDEPIAEKVKQRLAELDPRVGRLRVAAEGAEVAIDGAPSDGRAVVLPGQHLVTVQREGYQSFMRSVPVSPGETATVSVDLQLIAPPVIADPDEPLTGKWWFWAGAGAVAVAVVGVVVGIAVNTGGDDFVPAGELPRVSTGDWERF